MRFYLKEYLGVVPKKATYPCFVLVTNNWNDWGYRTLFKLFYYETKADRTEIGDVKILDRSLPDPVDEESITVLKESFHKLPPGYGSLGQNLEYYTELKRLLPDDYEQVLNALNDVAVNPGLRDRIERHTGFQRSLLRSSDAEKALNEAQQILTGTTRNVHNDFDFSYRIRLENADEEHDVRFVFKASKKSPFRTIVIIGKNGTGKTKFLTALANSLCDVKAAGSFKPSRPLFSKVIAIAFSMFDDFEAAPTSKKFSYKYIGYRKEDFVMDSKEIEKRLRLAFLEIKRKNREHEWMGFMERVIGLKDLANLFGLDAGSFDFTSEDFEAMIKSRSAMLSSGQSVLFFVITELVATLRRDSIILFDEPETHLHPNVTARLLKGLNELLVHYDSFAILATHSPIVVQETPGRNVKIFDRIGNTPIIKNLPSESFGENLSRITDLIFYRNEVKETFKEYFDDQMKTKTIQEINAQFDGNLSTAALLYLSAINSPRKKGKK